jgi:hypothetical protein
MAAAAARMPLADASVCMRVLMTSSGTTRQCVTLHEIAPARLIRPRCRALARFTLRWLGGATSPIALRDCGELGAVRLATRGAGRLAARDVRSSATTRPCAGAHSASNAIAPKTARARLIVDLLIASRRHNRF